MSYLVALDNGHGKDTPGKRTPYIPELGREIHEWEFNSAMVKFLDAELKRCGFKTLLTSPTSYDTSLKDRVAKANNADADIFVSVHFDALTGKFNHNASGHSVFAPEKAPNSKRLAECVHKYLVMGTKQVDRGIKFTDFYVIKYFKRAAILTENGFMDNKREALLMLDASFQKECAIEHAKGICEYFKVKYVPQSKPKPAPSKPSTGKSLYKVQTGAFGVKGNADALVKKLKSQGFEAFVTKDGKYYKVQTGAFSVKKNAEDLAKKLKSKGHNTYIIQS
jgi:N-acetylmuramoyl-L-alanine amidase